MSCSVFLNLDSNMVKKKRILKCIFFFSKAKPLLVIWFACLYDFVHVYSSILWSPCVNRLGCTKFQSLHGWLIFPSWPPFVWHWPPLHPLPSSPSNSQSSGFNPPPPHTHRHTHINLHCNKCKSLTWSLVGPWSDPRVIFSRGQGLKWQARFGGRCWGLERAKGGLSRPDSFSQALSRSATPVICISLLNFHQSHQLHLDLPSYMAVVDVTGCKRLWQRCRRKCTAVGQTYIIITYI